MNCDFLTISGHKMLSPMGIGVLYGKKKLLDNMKPFMYGGEMIEYVYETHSTFAELRFVFPVGSSQGVAGPGQMGPASRSYP